MDRLRLHDGRGRLTMSEKSWTAYDLEEFDPAGAAESVANEPNDPDAFRGGAEPDELWRAAIGLARWTALCANTPSFVAEFDRLSGCNMSGRGTPIDLMIDRATGRLETDVQRFVEYTHDLWERLPEDAKAEACGLPF